MSGRVKTHMFWSGVSRRVSPSAMSMVFCNSSSCGWVSISKAAVIWKSRASSRAIETSLSGLPRIGSPIERSAWTKRRLRGPPRHVAGLEMDVRHALVVADQEAQQHLGQIAPGLGVEPAHDPEIDGDDIAVRVHQQVAGVQVGVEEAVPEDLVEEGARRLAQHRVRIVAGGDQGVALVDGGCRPPAPA